MSDNPQALFDALGGPPPGFLFVDHVAIAVPRGTLDEQVAAYRLLGFEEVHREESRGQDGVREVMLRIGPGPNMIQWLERNGERFAREFEWAPPRHGGQGAIWVHMR